MVSAINNLGGSTFGVGGSPIAEPYKTDNTNWFKSKPYGFAFFDVNSKPGKPAKSTIYLPISPSNLTITTNYATNIVTTLYGIVEEHSEIRYFDIVIQGTTGIAPRYINERPTQDVDLGPPAPIGTSTQSTGRSAFESNAILGSLGGFLPEVTNTINQVADIFSDISGAINGINNPTGLTPDQSGYAAFHNLYKFLYKYKQDAAGVNQKGSSGGATGAAVAVLSEFASAGATSSSLNTKKREVHPLQFLNYKDGNKYDCIPMSFTMTRSADNPMMYYYNIRLRGFNLRSVDIKDQPGEDQLAKLGFGPLEGQSLFSSMTSIAGNAATLVSGIL